LNSKVKNRVKYGPYIYIFGVKKGGLREEPFEILRAGEKGGKSAKCGKGQKLE
jgi:hypothetical protein